MKYTVKYDPVATYWFNHPPPENPNTPYLLGDPELRQLFIAELRDAQYHELPDGRWQCVDRGTSEERKRR